MKIVILGGGAAGWFTALFADKYFNGEDIKVIESSKIGILGAGEGTTPIVINTLKFLDINVLDLIKKTGGTIKNGISFENWNGDNSKYFHGFLQEKYSYFIHSLINNKLNFNKEIYDAKMSYDNLVDPNNITYALHFDAHKIAEYLKTTALNRTIKLKIGDFKFAKTKNNKITSIVLEDGSIHECDFIFDCTGFNRLLVGKHYKTKWVDYQKYLPMKKAVPFMMDQDEEIKPYTQAIAMKYGWVWKIPLQHRFGSGYIYDSDYINADQAIEEASKYFKQNLKLIREIKFEAGRYEKVWVENCMAIGLSTGFTEPLEATSIWLSLSQLELLSHFLSDIRQLNKKSIDKFNDLIADNNENLMSFLHLHYLTKRKDSKFWKEFKHKTIMPDKLKLIFNELKDGTLNLKDISNIKGVSFSYCSYLQIAHGLNLIKKNKDMYFYKPIPSLEVYKKYVKEWSKGAINHRKFLQSL